ncbi:MAG: LemA family protein [Lentisphaeria bacterium]|nr:LemA family protein [Lentisphaeria bacterium]
MSVGLIITIVVAVLILFWWISTYNTFKRLQITIQEAWSGIDVQLKRKANIIPNLVDTIKMQMKFEEDVLTKLTAARSGLVSSNKEEAMAADNQVNHIMANIRATAEAYPELGTNASFRQMMLDIRDCEDKVTYARNRYNMTVSAYNQAIIVFPSSIVAGFAHCMPERCLKLRQKHGKKRIICGSASCKTEVFYACRRDPHCVGGSPRKLYQNGGAAGADGSVYCGAFLAPW